jgi:spermidine/putrescine transport system permease protein
VDGGQGVAVDEAGAVAAAAPPPLAARHAADARRGAFRLLYAAPVVFLLLFLIAPLLLMAALSTRPDMSGPLLSPWAPTLAQYGQVPNYLRLLGISMAMAAIVAAAATALAYPVAYFLRFRAGDRAALLLLLLLVPFWTSYLLRVMAWKLMLGLEGAINSFLLSFGLVGEPLAALLYNREAVVVTLVYVWIPFATLPILAALQRVDPLLHEAAGDLYARPFEQFRRVTLPLSMPGLLAAFFMVFIPTVGEYITPLLVGGTGGTMYGNIIQDFFVRAANWPLGAAMSIVMLVVTLILAAMALKLIDVRRFSLR